jgi:hypothetical protein
MPLKRRRRAVGRQVVSMPVEPPADDRAERMAADPDGYFATARTRARNDIRARRNRQARRHQVAAPGVVKIRLQGRAEDVDALRGLLAAVMPLWQDRDEFDQDENGITGRRYFSTDVRRLRSPSEGST